jgi:hypothetical protein
MSSCDILKCVVLPDSLVKEHQKKLPGVEEELYLDDVPRCLDTSRPVATLDQLRDGANAAA